MRIGLDASLLVRWAHDDQQHRVTAQGVGCPESIGGALRDGEKRQDFRMTVSRRSALLPEG